MFVFLALAILSLAVLIAGFIWLLAAQGRTTRRSGRDAGAEVMAGIGDEDDEAIPLVEKSVFAGTGVAVTRDVDVSYADLKRLVRERRWRQALPALLVVIGFFGLVVFGVLALWLALDDKLIATAIAAVVLFTMARILRA
jgi:hypothetical protein